MMNILEVLRKRYTCKLYDSSKKISQTDIDKLKEVLQLGISSVNSQPWHFFIISGEQKQRMAETTHDYNIQKIKDCSHLVVFCSKEFTEEHINSVQNLSATGRMNMTFVELLLNRPDLDEWTAKQVYLNFGMFITACATLGIDATTMEGFVPELVSKQLSLDQKGLKPLILVALGYRHQDDPNDISRKPKARFAQRDIITELK